MYYFKHADEPSIISDELPEYTDTCCNCEANDDQELQTPAKLESTEDMSSWFASDEAALWMGM